MENIIIEDEIEYKKINNINALVLKINYPSIKIKSQSNYKTWLEIQKKERGNNGFVSFCRKCNVLFYFISENEENITKKKCCNDYCYGKICDYCGELYFENSFCCLKNGIIESFKLALFDGNYTCEKDVYYITKIIPFMFIVYFSFNLLFGIFMNRRMTINGNMFSSICEKVNRKIDFLFIIIALLVLLYTLLYMIPFLILYHFYLSFVLIQICKKKNNNNNNEPYNYNN